MNNKKIGNNFEKYTSEYLSENGFWVYRINSISILRCLKTKFKGFKAPYS